MFKTMTKVFMAIFFLSSFLVQFEAAHAEEKRFSIGTAGISGVLYPFGVSLAQTITKHTDMQATGEASAGSIENIRNLTTGKTALAFSQNQNATQAYQGTHVYKNRPAKDLRSIMATLVSYMHIFVPKDSTVTSIQDLKGQRVSVGAAGSGGEVDTRMLLEFHGLNYQTIKPQFIPESEAISALKDGRIDAIIATHPLNSTAMTELTQSMDLKLIPVADDSFYTTYPYFTKGTIEAGTYPNIDTDTYAPRIVSALFTSTNSGLSDDQIYQITKAIWENENEWINVHASVTKNVSLKNALSGLIIPLSKGALKYYEEIGIEVPEYLK